MGRFPVNEAYTDGSGGIVVGGTVVIYEFLSSNPDNPTVVATFYENKTGGSAVTSVTTDSNGAYEVWLDNANYDSDQIFTLITSKSTHVDVPYHFTVPSLGSAGKATTELDNLGTVAINTSLKSDTDVTDDLGDGDTRWNNGYIANIRAGLTATDKLILQARDVDGASWQDILTITSANTPTADLWASTTIDGKVILQTFIAIAISNETTALTTGTAKATFRMPFAMTLTDVRASVTTAPTDATLTIDINESGSTILSTKLTIDATEKTSTTAALPAVISDAALADDAEITIDIDQIGSSVAGAGAKVYLIGTRA